MDFVASSQVELGDEDEVCHEQNAGTTLSE